MFGDRRVVSGFTALLVSCAAAGCVTTGPRMKIVTPTPHVVALGTTTKPIQLSKIMFRVGSGTEVGKINYGMLCDGSVAATAGDMEFDFTGPEMQRAFISEMNNANFQVVGNPDNLFDEGEASGAEYLIGAAITGLRIAGCFPGYPQGSPEGSADISLTVNWQVYSVLDRRVVFETTKTGAGHAEGVKPARRSAPIAFANATRALLADDKFYALLTGEQGATPAQSGAGAGASTQRAAIALAALPALSGPIQPRMDDIRNAVVTVLVGPGAHGSGFFVDRSGYLLTNAHVAGNAKRLTIRLADGTTRVANVLATDRPRDIALLKVEGGAPSVLPISFGTPEIGTDVYAVGSPLDEALSASVSRGILSSRRVLRGMPVLQSDVNVQPGSSGGPLLDVSGNVIGVTASGRADLGVPAGINFFIPIQDALAKLNIRAGTPQS